MAPWCAPGFTLCCICFECVPDDRLAADTDGQLWDVCRGDCAVQAGIDLPPPPLATYPTL